MYLIMPSVHMKKPLGLSEPMNGNKQTSHSDKERDTLASCILDVASNIVMLVGWLPMACSWASNPCASALPAAQAQIL